MNTRVLLTLAFAMIFGLAAGYSALRYLNSRPEAVQPTTGDGETVPVVLAAQDLSLGTILEEDHLKVVDWPATTLPLGYVATTQELIGQSLISNVYANEVILTSKLAQDGLRGIIPLIPEGMRAMSIAADQVLGVAGFATPQTRVDVILIMDPQGSDDTVSKTILQNIRVLAADQEIREAEDGTPYTVSVVTVAVTPEEAEKLFLASNEGVIRLALRHALDLQAVETPGVRASRLFSGTPSSLPRSASRVGASSPSTEESVMRVYRGGAQSLIRY